MKSWTLFLEDIQAKYLLLNNPRTLQKVRRKTILLNSRLEGHTSSFLNQRKSCFMADQNAANSGANNTEGTTAVTAGDGTNTAGQNQPTGGANTTGQTNANAGDSGKISFTPEQQSYINSLLKTENQKAVDKAMKKVNDEKDLSEKEKAEKRATEAEQALSERDKRDAFKDAVAAAKTVDSNALYQLVGGELEFENGKFKNLTKVLDQAKVSYPYLFPHAEGSADAGKKDETAINTEVKPGVDRMRNAYANSSKK